MSPVDLSRLSVAYTVTEQAECPLPQRGLSTQTMQPLAKLAEGAVGIKLVEGRQEGRPEEGEGRPEEGEGSATSPEHSCMPGSAETPPAWTQAASKAISSGTLPCAPQSLGRLECVSTQTWGTGEAMAVTEEFFGRKWHG